MDPQTFFEAVDDGNLAEVDDGLRKNPKWVSLTTEWDGSTPLHVAAMCGHVDIAALLISAGARIDARNHAVQADNVTPLHLAAGLGHADVARLLIAKGADVNDRADVHGWGPLGWASMDGPHEEVAQVLLDAGAEWTVLAALRFRRADALRDLLSRRPEVAEETQGKFNHFQLPLHDAIAIGFEEGVQVLVEAGANINRINWLGLSPLATARAELIPGMEKLLAGFGAEVDASARLFTTGKVVLSDHELEPGGAYHRLLHCCAERGWLEPARSLLAAGADPNLMISYWATKVTPMHPACSYGHVEVVRALAEAGAALEFEDELYQATPLDWAKQYDRNEVVDYLESFYNL